MAATMDVSSAKWLSDLEMEDYGIIHQYHMNSFIDELKAAQEIMGPSNQNHLQQTFSSSSSQSFSSSYRTDEHQPQHLKTEHISTKLPSSPPPATSSCILSFENFGSNTNNRHPVNFQNGLVKPKDEAVSPGNTMNFSQTNNNSSNSHGCGIKRTHSFTRHAQDHILAERKRREKLSERFIALSAILPHLKKTDKASVLGEAIKHIKDLHERVKGLEEQRKKRAVESAVLVNKKSPVCLADQSDSGDGGPSDGSSGCFEIEAKVSDKDVLIRIHCEKQRGHVVKILGEIEKFQLCIINSSVLPFGDSILDITVMAQKENGFDMKVGDLVKNLRSALSKFM